MQPGRRPADVQLLGHHHERPQLAQFHSDDHAPNTSTLRRTFIGRMKVRVPTVEGSKGTTVTYIPFSVIKAVHEQTHSAFPNAPVVQHVPRRHPLRAVRRLFRSTPTPSGSSLVDPPACGLSTDMTGSQPTTSLVNPPNGAEGWWQLPDATTGTTGRAGSGLCEAEVRDRGTTAASAA